MFLLYAIGNALKCYKREVFDPTNPTDQGLNSMEPILVDCKENEDVCVSSFVKTEVIWPSGATAPAGTWNKNCVNRLEMLRSNTFSNEEKKEFVDGKSDHCIELSRGFAKVSM